MISESNVGKSVTSIGSHGDGIKGESINLYLYGGSNGVIYVMEELDLMCDEGYC